MVDLKKGFITIFMVAIIAILLSACGQKTYEIDSEVRVAFNGYEGHGIATVHLDVDDLYSSLSQTVKIKNPNDSSILDMIVSNMEVNVSPQQDLKNGDEVELSLIYPEENDLKLKLKLKNKKVKVTDLEPIKKISQEDIFAGIDVQFEGVSPFLQAIITENSSTDISDLFSYSVTEGYVKEGNDIEVIAEPYSELVMQGYEADEKDFTNKIKVSGQYTYAAGWDDLNADDQAYILAEIGDIVTAKIDGTIQDDFNSIYDKGDQVATGRFISKKEKSSREENSFLFIKESAFTENIFGSNNDVNSIRMIFKSKITFSDSTYNEAYTNKTKDYYSVAGVSNIILDGDGKLVREEAEFKTYGKPDIDKETVKNETIYKIKDVNTIDEFEVKEKK